MEEQKTKKVLIVIIIGVISLVILVCGILFLIWFLNSRNTTNNVAPSNTTSQPVENNPQNNTADVSCTIDSSPSKETTVAYETDINFPTVSGCDSKAQDDLNQYISDAINQSSKDVKFTDPDLTVGKNTLTLDFKVILNTKKFISILISGYEYLGGAHGMNIFIPINYDMVNNKELSIADIGKTTFINKLSAYSIPALKEKLNDSSLDSTIESGASAIAENFGVFNVSKEGLIITFTDYQIGPYALGPQKLTIPWIELSSTLTVEFKNSIGI